MIQDPFKPAARVAGQRQDVWSIVNEAAAQYNEEHGAGSVVNMGERSMDPGPAGNGTDSVEARVSSATIRLSLFSTRPGRHWAR